MIGTGSLTQRQREVMIFAIRELHAKLLIIWIVFALGATPARAGTDETPVPVAAGAGNALPPVDVPTKAATRENAAPPAVPPTAAADAVRDLITRQMEAIRARDAEAAFAQTSPSFHEHFDTAKKFLSHIRFEQRALYNHSGFTFLDRHDIDGGGVLQKISVRDSFGGAPVTAVFRLEQDANGQWLIDSLAILGGGGDDAEPI